MRMERTGPRIKTGGESTLKVQEEGEKSGQGDGQSSPQEAGSNLESEVSWSQVKAIFKEAEEGEPWC